MAKYVCPICGYTYDEAFRSPGRRNRTGDALAGGARKLGLSALRRAEICI
jgi:transposase-like protein